MSFKIIPLKPFKKFYKSRNKKEKIVIDAKFEILKKDPYDYDNLNIKKLAGYENRYRLRINNYRIIYEVYNIDLIIVVADGGNRGDIYK